MTRWWTYIIRRINGFCGNIAHLWLKTWHYLHAERYESSRHQVHRLNHGSQWFDRIGEDNTPSTADYGSDANKRDFDRFVLVLSYWCQINSQSVRKASQARNIAVADDTICIETLSAHFVDWDIAFDVRWSTHRAMATGDSILFSTWFLYGNDNHFNVIFAVFETYYTVSYSAQSQPACSHTSKVDHKMFGAMVLYHFVQIIAWFTDWERFRFHEWLALLYSLEWANDPSYISIRSSNFNKIELFIDPVQTKILDCQWYVCAVAHLPPDEMIGKHKILSVYRLVLIQHRLFDDIHEFLQGEDATIQPFTIYINDL